MFRRLVAVLALLVVLVAGCGDASPPEGDSGPNDPSPTSAPPSLPAEEEPFEEEPADPEPTEEGAATTVTSISMQRSGGVAGVNDQWRLAPGDEFSDEAFELAARRSELEAEAGRLDDERVCCDFFVYRLTVHYEDGTFNAVVDDDPEATLIWELVDAVAGTSRAEPDKPRS